MKVNFSKEQIEQLKVLSKRIEKDFATIDDYRKVEEIIKPNKEAYDFLLVKFKKQHITSLNDFYFIWKKTQDKFELSELIGVITGTISGLIELSKMALEKEAPRQKTESEIEKIVKLFYSLDGHDKTFHDTVGRDEKIGEYIIPLIRKPKDKLLAELALGSFIKQKTYHNVKYQFNDTLNNLKKVLVEFVNIINDDI